MIQETENPLLVYVVLKNEVKRLPFFLKHYRNLGVDHFVIVDNDSTDGSREFLLSQEDVTVYHTKDSFASSKFGMRWIAPLIHQYSWKQWCIIVDADEFFIYPRCEEISLRSFCRFLDREGATVLPCTLIDMYAKDFPDLSENQGDPLWKMFPYFDSDVFNEKCNHGQFSITRKRLFGIDVAARKSPLVKHGWMTELNPGMHSHKRVRRSAMLGVVFHFKYDKDFLKRVEIEKERGEHWNNAFEYKVYSKVMNREGFVSFFDPEHSTKLESFDDLESYGILKSSPLYDLLYIENEVVNFPYEQAWTINRRQ